ncbi:MAG: ABC transporter permease [Marinifilaceae bacterium]
MIKNYLTVAFRNLLREKSYSLINILGLTTGLTASILLIIFIFHELSFDRFHEKADRIYRVTTEVKMPNGNVLNAGMTIGTLGPKVKEAIPEIEQFLRVEQKWGEYFIKYENQSIKTEKHMRVDTNFFDFFSFKLLQGNKKKIFADPQNIVLSETMAKKIFGKQSPLGKNIKVNETEFTVSGVAADAPANSHMSYTSIISIKGIRNPERYYSNRGISIPTYFLLQKKSVNACIIDKIERETEQGLNDFITEKGSFGETKTRLQALKDIHLGKGMVYDFSPSGKKSTIWVLIALSIFILLIAVINFTNLFIAKSEQRIKEVGVRKSLGAHPGDLRKQFWGESTLTTLISLLISFGITELLLPEFSKVTNRVLSFEIITSPLFWIIISLVTGFTIFLSGTYPALYLSRFTPAFILRGAHQNGKNKHLLKSLLVLIQFSIAVFLIANLLILNQQMDYLQSKDLGFNKNENLVVTPSDDIGKNYENIKERLLKLPSIQSVSGSSRHPGREGDLQSCRREGDDVNSSFLIYQNRIQDGYVETLGLKVISGRDFDPHLASDSSATLINRTAAQKLGFNDPIGKKIDMTGRKLTIIGVLEDYNFLDLHKEIQPILLTRFNNWCNHINIRMKLNNQQETIRKIERILHEYDPNFQMNNFFINDFYNETYKEEQNTMHIVLAASLVAIVLSILGLFSLTSFIILRRTKEIGIRKTMGASEGTIVLALGIPILKFILLSNLFAWPLSYIIMNKWLQNFAYRIEISFYLLLLASFIGLLIASFTISFKILNAARANPVVALKTE